MVLGGGVHVQDAAPQGELADALHLLAPGIAQGGELVGQPVQVVLPAVFDGDGVLCQFLRGEGALQKALHRGYDEGGLPPSHGMEGGEAPVLPLAGGHGRVVEEKFPGGQQRDFLPGKGGQVGGQTAALLLIGAHHHHRAVPVPPDTRGEMGPVDRGQAGNRRRGAARVQRVQQLLELRDLV